MAAATKPSPRWTNVGADEPAAQGDLRVSLRPSRTLHLQRQTVSGRTVCLNWASTGLWGSRWATTGSTRSPSRKNTISFAIKRSSGQETAVRSQGVFQTGPEKANQQRGLGTSARRWWT